MTGGAPPPLSQQLRPVLWLGLGLLAAAGLVVELLHVGSHSEPIELLVRMLSLSYEQNLPTWYASSLLFSCGLALAAITRDARARRLPHRGRWAVLAAGFFYMSVDEAVELHEHLGGHFGGEGLLYFDWVIPASVVVLVVGAAYWPFLRALPARRRRQFLLAGALYVGGAVAFELPLGWWTERAGEENVVYALIDWGEELLELVGASLFLLSLLEHWQQREEAA